MSAKSKTVDVSLSAEVAAAGKALAPAVKRLAKALKALDPARLPVGSLADLLYDLRQAVKTLNAVTAPFDDIIAPAIKQVEEHFINSLAVGEATGVQGLTARVQVTDRAIPTVENWDLFYAHIKKTANFELLNRAVNRKAVEERWEQHARVPGVGVFHDKKVSCTKLGGK